jgi:excisionase family DNA binding protein
LSVKHVAAALSVSAATVYSLVERGELAHFRVRNAIRIGEGELAAYLARARPR